jgi:hypothetical protein
MADLFGPQFAAGMGAKQGENPLKESRIVNQGIGSTKRTIRSGKFAF